MEKGTETIGTARGITDTGELLVEDLTGKAEKAFFLARFRQGIIYSYA